MLSVFVVTPDDIRQGILEQCCINVQSFAGLAVLTILSELEHNGEGALLSTDMDVVDPSVSVSVLVATALVVACCEPLSSDQQIRCPYSRQLASECTRYLSLNSGLLPRDRNVDAAVVWQSQGNATAL